jgi:hypothetical protein
MGRRRGRVMTPDGSDDMSDASPDSFVYRPVDSAVSVPSHERHTEEVTFRLSPRLLRALEQTAEAEQTSISEVVREALAVRWRLR